MVYWFDHCCFHGGISPGLGRVQEYLDTVQHLPLGGVTYTNNNSWSSGLHRTTHLGKSNIWWWLLFFRELRENIREYCPLTHKSTLIHGLLILLLSHLGLTLSLATLVVKFNMGCESARKLANCFSAQKCDQFNQIKSIIMSTFIPSQDWPNTGLTYQYFKCYI